MIDLHFLYFFFFLTLLFLLALFRKRCLYLVHSD